MIRRLLLIAPLLIVLNTSNAAPPELMALQQQFALLVAKKVTGPYDDGIEALNTKFLNALINAGEEAKKTGNLPDALAIEEDKKLIISKQQLPEKDDEKTSTSLKKLHAVYRTESAKFTQQRTAAHEALLPAYTAKLKELEITLTKGGRLAEAREVMQYREELGTVLPPAPVGKELTNSLGMKFVQVPGTKVFFCIHEVRYQDYAAFVDENQDMDSTWKNQSVEGFTPADHKEQHPVINVSWEDAQKFCVWLSKKEGKTYRLPTDEEWSFAVGLGNLEKRPNGTTPGMLDRIEKTQYPWGDDFPPKTKNKAGNYLDVSRKYKTRSEAAQEPDSYYDGYPTTAPVMSFRPNKLGIYDLGGNVFEWCEDWYDSTQSGRVLRGAAFDIFDKDRLLSSFRRGIQPGMRVYCHGFRCVLVVSKG